MGKVAERRSRMWKIYNVGGAWDGKWSVEDLSN